MISKICIRIKSIETRYALGKKKEQFLRKQNL